MSFISTKYIVFKYFRLSLTLNSELNLEYSVNDFGETSRPCIFKDVFALCKHLRKTEVTDA